MSEAAENAPASLSPRLEEILKSVPDRAFDPEAEPANSIEGLTAAFQTFLARHAWGEADYAGLSRRDRVSGTAAGWRETSSSATASVV